MKAKLFKVDGTVVDVQPKNGTDFQLQEMYDLIGTDIIEIVHLYNGMLMVIDEEGKLRNDPQVNPIATHLWMKDKPHSWDYIVGNALVCDPKMVK